MVVGRVGDQVLTNEAGEETRWVGRAVAPLYVFELCRYALSASGFSFGHSQLCSFYPRGSIRLAFVQAFRLPLR